MRDESHLPGRLAGRADDLLMPPVPDQEDMPAGFGEPDGLAMERSDQGTGGVDRFQAPRRRFAPHRGRDTVRGKEDNRPGGNLVDRLDETDPFLFEILDDPEVVDDFVEDVDRRRAGLGTCARQYLHRAVHSGAETARLDKDQSHFGQFPRRRARYSRSSSPPSA